MTNSWSNQEYVQGFGCDTISFKKAVNILESMKLLKVFMKVW